MSKWPFTAPVKAIVLERFQEWVSTGDCARCRGQGEIPAVDEYGDQDVPDEHLPLVECYDCGGSGEAGFWVDGATGKKETWTAYRKGS